MEAGVHGFGRLQRTGWGPDRRRGVTSVMESLARFKRWSQVVAVPELGLTGLLAAVTDERLVDYSRRHLGPLTQHDTTRKGNLVATLRAYLETGEQQQAAQRLRVHPNTLRYRLDRIREIRGVEFHKPPETPHPA